MSDAWDFAVSAIIQTLRAGISYLKLPPYVLEGVSFALALLEGSILSNTLPDRRRITIYPAVMLVLRILFDFISSKGMESVLIGMGGTLIGLLVGPIFHSPPSYDSDGGDGEETVGRGTGVGTGLRTTNTHTRRVPRPVTLHTVDIDNETSKQVLFTPALSLRTLGGDDAATQHTTHQSSTSQHSYTRVDDSFDTDDTVRYDSAGGLQSPPATDNYHASYHEVEGGRPGSVKDIVRKLRSQAKSDDINRRNLLAEREAVLQEGDISRAFLLKHQADALKKSMVESDREAAKAIYEYYNPPNRKDRTRIDVRGLQASEAIKFLDEALTDLQEAGGNVMTVALGRSKNTDGPGKGKVKPNIRQYAKSQGINVRETEDGGMLILSLPTLRSPIGFD